MVRLDQKPFVATEPSPPRTTAIALPYEESLSTWRWYKIAWAQPADGVYCEPTSPPIGRTVGPPREGRLQTTPMSRPSLNPPDFARGAASASSSVSPRL